MKDREDFALRFTRERYGACNHKAHYGGLWCATHGSYWPKGEVCHALRSTVADVTAALVAWDTTPEHIATPSWPYRPTQPKEKP